MTDVVLIVVTSLMFLFGWFLMKQLDFILDEIQKRIKKASEKQQPEPCVHLVGNISPDELEETFSQFCFSLAHVVVVIYDSEHISFPDNKKGPENFLLPVLFFHFIIPDMLRLLYLLLLHLLLSAEHL